MTRMLVPIERFEGENSPISQHFGKAPMFVLVSLTSDGRIGELNPTPNSGEHFGGRGTAELLALRFKPDVVVVKGMGPRGLRTFKEKGIQVFTGAINTVREAVDAYLAGKLMTFTEPCREARHQ